MFNTRVTKGLMRRVRDGGARDHGTLVDADKAKLAKITRKVEKVSKAVGSKKSRALKAKIASLKKQLAKAKSPQKKKALVA
jgi:tRNA A37 threonylcarbamoyladenosine dehydratase